MGAAIDAQLPELMDACLGEARLLKPFLYAARLDGDGMVSRDRDNGSLVACIDATISGWALPAHGSACSLDLVVARSPERPWRWTSQRPVASRQKAGHR